MRLLNIEGIDHQRGYQKASIYLSSLSEEEKEDLLKVEHLLALYLIDMAEHVIVNFYRVVCVFTTLLRDCVNDLAWDKISNYKLMLDLDSTTADDDGTFTKRPPTFTTTKCACIDQNGQSGIDMIF
jgi:hypothetical protein